MFIYRITKADDRILNKMGENNRELTTIYNNKFYFKKKVATRTSTKEVVKTKEWNEFYNIYKEIKSNGLSNGNLTLKYNKLVKEGKHQLIMNNLVQYKKYLDVKKKHKYALMAQTYINQARYYDDWSVFEDISRKWLDELFEKRELSISTIDNVISEVNARENRTNKEITYQVAENLINYVITGEI